MSSTRAGGSPSAANTSMPASSSRAPCAARVPAARARSAGAPARRRRCLGWRLRRRRLGHGRRVRYAEPHDLTSVSAGVTLTPMSGSWPVAVGPAAGAGPGAAARAERGRAAAPQRAPTRRSRPRPRSGSSDRVVDPRRVLRRVVPVGEPVPRPARTAGRPLHVAVLLDNTPDYLFAFGGAALVGAAVVGLNHTRRGEHLLRDVEHTALRARDHRAAPRARCSRRSPSDLPPVLTSTRFADADDPDADARRDARRRARRDRRDDPGIEPDVDTIWALIFTSGTSDAPKAVICSQRRLLVTGNRMGDDHGPRRPTTSATSACRCSTRTRCRSAGRRRSSCGASVGLGRRFSRVGLAARRPPLRRDLLQLHRQAARVPARARPSSPTTPTTRCGSRSATRARPRSSTTFAPPLRRRGDRRVRRDRGRRRGQPRRRACAPARSGTRPTTCRSSTRTATRSRAPRFDADGRLRERRRVRRRDRQHRGRRAVRGLLQQRRGDRDDDALRLVLVGRPRLPRRRRLPLLRRPQRRLDPRRRRELPGRADRGGAARAPRRRARRGLRRARRPGRRPGDGRARAARRRRRSIPAAFAALARRAGRRSGRSGGRATCASCATRRRPARTRS